MFLATCGISKAGLVRTSALVRERGGGGGGWKGGGGEGGRRGREEGTRGGGGGKGIGRRIGGILS